MTHKSHKKRPNAKDLILSPQFSDFKSEYEKSSFKNGQYEVLNSTRKQNFEVRDLNSNKM